MLLSCQMPISHMKEIVTCNISLLESADKSLHPCNRICDKSLFEGLVIPRDLIKDRVLLRRPLL